MRSLILPALAGLLAACASVPADANDTPRRTNVLVIVADDLGFHDIGANNPDGFYDTPNLDRLARSGVRFTRGYAANPVCSPTRYSLMTGKYPTRAQATNYFSGRRAGRFAPAPFEDRMQLEERTLAEALKAAGYATFFAGKWHLGPDEDHWPTRQGFDVNRGGHASGGPYGGKKYFSPYGNPRLEDGPDGEHLPDRLAREALAFASEPRDAPFFAYLCFYSVHTPLMAPPELVAKYEARAAALPDTGPVFATEEQVFPDAVERRVRVVQDHAVYAAMVEAMDRAVGVLLDGLEERGLADDTLVVFTSDHGGLSTSEGHPTSNLPLRGGKGWTYEGGLRVPLLVRWPGHTRAGTTSDVPALSTDLFPTVLDICDVDEATASTQAAAVDGQSLAAVLEGGAGPERDLHWHYPHYSNQGGFPSGALLEVGKDDGGAWKLIERFEDGSIQLFDLRHDPGERDDLSDRHPERVAAMRARLHAWYQDVDARFLEPLEPGGPQPWRPR